MGSSDQTTVDVLERRVNPPPLPQCLHCLAICTATHPTAQPLPTSLEAWRVDPGKIGIQYFILVYAKIMLWLQISALLKIGAIHACTYVFIYVCVNVCMCAYCLFGVYSVKCVSLIYSNIWSADLRYKLINASLRHTLKPVEFFFNWNLLKWFLSDLIWTLEVCTWGRYWKSYISAA
jgi:hypothetical protein